MSRRSNGEIGSTIYDFIGAESHDVIYGVVGVTKAVTSPVGGAMTS